MIAALYVETDGVYVGVPDVDTWDESRDARLYAGPWPVVAHPPCNTWSVLAALVRAMTGRPIGDDGGAFASALAAVRRFGGVLEHPAKSFAWAAHELPRPRRGYWRQTFDDVGWVTEVSQVAYGHPAQKRTWLYYVGKPPPALDWREPAASIIVSDLGSGNQRGRGDEWRAGVQYDDASRTPLAFRDALLDLVREGCAA
jgi:hypothetical protein